MSTVDKIFVFLVYFILSLILVIVLYPLLYVVAASFSDPQAVIRGEVFIFPVRTPILNTKVEITSDTDAFRSFCIRKILSIPMLTILEQPKISMMTMVGIMAGISTCW